MQGEDCFVQIDMSTAALEIEARRDLAIGLIEVLSLMVKYV